MERQEHFDQDRRHRKNWQNERVKYPQIFKKDLRNQVEKAT